MRPESLIEHLEDFFPSRPSELIAVYLYGSRARDRASKASDVDLAVLFSRQPLAILGGPPDRLANELEAELGMPIEIVTLNYAPAELVGSRWTDPQVIGLPSSPSCGRLSPRPAGSEHPGRRSG